MSNVEYRCPFVINPATGQKCGMRLFAPPGGTPHHCLVHTDTIYQQVEDYHGPNFEYKDDGDTDPKKTGVITVGAEHVTPQVVEVHPPNMSEDELLIWYREQYLKITKSRPDMRWGLNTIKTKLTEWEEANTPPPEKSAEEGQEESTPTDSIPEEVTQ